jgi:transposase-like protein
VEEKRAMHRYSEELKQRIVEEIEGGGLSIREAARDTRAGVGQVQKWLEEYGRYRPKRDVVEVVMKSEKDKIAELEKALAEAHLKIRVYDQLITEANKCYKTDIKKNFGMRPPESSAEEKEGARLSKPAKSSAARGTRTTNAAIDGGDAPGRRQS